MIEPEVRDGSDTADLALTVWALVIVAALILAAAGAAAGVILPLILVTLALFIVGAAAPIGRYPMIGTLTVALGVVAVVGLFFLRNGLREDFGGQGQGGRIECYDCPGYAWLSYPGDDDEPREVAYTTCAAQSVESLARLLSSLHTDDFTGAPVGPRTRATAEAIARGYARFFHRPALYTGCMQGFRDSR